MRRPDCTLHPTLRGCQKPGSCNPCSHPIALQWQPTLIAPEGRGAFKHPHPVCCPGARGGLVPLVQSLRSHSPVFSMWKCYMRERQAELGGQADNSPLEPDGLLCSPLTPAMWLLGQLCHLPTLLNISLVSTHFSLRDWKEVWGKLRHRGTKSLIQDLSKDNLNSQPDTHFQCCPH